MRATPTERERARQTSLRDATWSRRPISHVRTKRRGPGSWSNVSSHMLHALPLEGVRRWKPPRARPCLHTKGGGMSIRSIRLEGACVRRQSNIECLTTKAVEVPARRTRDDSCSPELTIVLEYLSNGDVWSAIMAWVEEKGHRDSEKHY